MKQSKINIIFLCSILLILSACSSTKVETGPSIELGPVEVGLHLNTDGNFILECQASVPIIPIPPLGGVNWDVAFETTLNEAQSTENYLYVLWDQGDGSIYRQAYAMNRPFDITFEQAHWVRRISHSGDGNIIVYVELEKLSEESYLCMSNMNTRLSVGKIARVTTTQSHLPLRIRTLPITETWTYITSLDEGTEMRISDGPACNENWIWWKVNTENGFTGWVSEGDGFTWFIEPIPES